MPAEPTVMVCGLWVSTQTDLVAFAVHTAAALTSQFLGVISESDSVGDRGKGRRQQVAVGALAALAQRSAALSTHRAESPRYRSPSPR